jgi:hypothetical protein
MNVQAWLYINSTFESELSHQIMLTYRNAKTILGARPPVGVRIQSARGLAENTKKSIYYFTKHQLFTNLQT